MLRIHAAALAGGLLLSACATVADPAVTALPAPSAEPAPRPEMGGALPANSELVLRLTTNLSADSSRVGDIFTASLEDELTAVNGEVVLPAGTVVTGMVTGVNRSEQIGDPAALRLNFLRINVAGVTHPFTADVVGAHLPMSEPAPVAASGPVLGAVISGELRESMTGLDMELGAGTIISLGSGETAAVLPGGTHLVVRSRDRLELR